VLGVPEFVDEELELGVVLLGVVLLGVVLLGVVLLGVVLLGVLLIVALLLLLPLRSVLYSSLLPPCCLQPISAKAAQRIRIVFFIRCFLWLFPLALIQCRNLS
jgi:hypothetical protein